LDFFFFGNHHHSNQYNLKSFTASSKQSNQTSKTQPSHITTKTQASRLPPITTKTNHNTSIKMSASTSTMNNLVVPSQDSSKNTSFDSRRSSGASATSAEGQQVKPAGTFKRIGRAIKQRAIEHHRSVTNAHRAVYGY
jgi:hypothetical protein